MENLCRPYSIYDIYAVPLFPAMVDIGGQRLARRYADPDRREFVVSVRVRGCAGFRVFLLFVLEHLPVKRRHTEEYGGTELLKVTEHIFRRWWTRSEHR